MYSDSSKRAEKILSIAQPFRDEGYNNTIQLIESIAEDIRSNNTDDTHKKYLEFKKQFCLDYSKNNAKLEELARSIVDTMTKPFETYGVAFWEKTKEIVLYLESFKQRISILGDFADNLMKSNPTSLKYLFMNKMILYGWIVEVRKTTCKLPRISWVTISGFS